MSVKEIQGDDNTLVTLTYNDVYEGRHCDDQFTEWAVSETATVSKLNSVVTSGVEVLSDMKTPFSEAIDSEVLEGFEEVGDSSADQEEYIRENFYDFDDFISTSVEQWDYKEGSCTVSATALVKLGDIRKNEETFSGWTATVPMGSGKFTIDL